MEGLDVCISERLCDVTYINVRHILSETGVSLELKLLALWRVDDPFPVGTSGDSKAIFLELWDGEKVCNSSFVEPHLENSKVPNLRAFFGACVAIPIYEPAD